MTLDLELMGKRIWDARERKGWTITDLANFSGVSRTQTKGIEYGRIKPRLETLMLLCVALEVSADWLLGLTDVQETYTRRAADEARREMLAEKKRREGAWF